MTLSPGWAGFLKGILNSVVLVLVTYLADSAHLTGIMTPAIAFAVAGIFSGIESSLKARSNGTTALFGAVSVRK